MQTVIERVAAKHPDLTKKVVKEIVRETMDTIVEVTQETGRVAFPGNIFRKATRQERNGRNPKTGEPIRIPSKTVITYRHTR